MKNETGFEHLQVSSHDAVLYAVKHYSEAATQLKFLEDTRWRQLRVAALSDSLIASVAAEHGVTSESIRKVISTLSEKKGTLTRKEIRTMTGYPAMPVMRAVCSILHIPISLRGINPKRVSEKGYGARGKPLHFIKRS